MQIDKNFNLQAWTDVRLVAQVVLFFEKKGVHIKSRSDLVLTMLKLVGGDITLSTQTAIETLEGYGMIPRDDRTLSKLRRASSIDQSEASLKDIAEQLLGRKKDE